MVSEYFTLENKVEEILLTEKGSRFIGYAFPVNDEEEVKFHLSVIKKIHPKASHHCYAYRLGYEGENYRANDDGEPSGTAGLPIYNQILAAGITFTLVIIVRYFGGTKLGSSGLIKAYKDSAKAVLSEAKICKREIKIQLKISFPYDIQDRVFGVINRNQINIKEFTTAGNCTILTDIKQSEQEKIPAFFSGIPGVEFNFD